MNRRVVLISSAVVAVVAVVVLSLFIWFRAPTTAAAPPSASTSVSPGSTSAPTLPAPRPAATTTADLAHKHARALVIPFVSAEAASRESPDSTVTFDSIATGDALADLEANATSFAADGLVQIGQPNVVSAKVTKATTSGKHPAATVRVCLDYSKVDVRGADGRSEKDPNAAERLTTILKLTQINGEWLVSQRTFPDKADC